MPASGLAGRVKEINDTDVKKKKTEAKNLILQGGCVIISLRARSSVG